MSDSQYNLYRISQTMNNGWDTYDEAVVCACSEYEARMTHPARYVEKWSGVEDSSRTWCDAEFVEVELIGTALPGMLPGVICSSFIAG